MSYTNALHMTYSVSHVFGVKLKKVLNKKQGIKENVKILKVMI